MNDGFSEVGSGIRAPQTVLRLWRADMRLSVTGTQMRTVLKPMTEVREWRITDTDRTVSPASYERARESEMPGPGTPEDSERHRDWKSGYAALLSTLSMCYR